MVGTGGGAGGGTYVRTKDTPTLSKSTISILDMSAVGVDATRKDWASPALSRRIAHLASVAPASLLHCDSIQGTRLCSSMSGNSARCRLAINRKIAASLSAHRPGIRWFCEAARHAWIRGDETPHFIGVSGGDHHDAVAVVFHELINVAIASWPKSLPSPASE